MAPKISCSFVSILVLFLANQPFAIRSRSLEPTSSSVTSFQGLEGAFKGQTKRGIKEVKLYLKAFGYLDSEGNENDVALVNDEFDDTLESALRSYQTFYRLEVTGKLDIDTTKQMSTPRCGLPDFVHPRQAERNATNASKFHMVARYTFFPDMPKWPPPKTHLIYTFISVPEAIRLEELRGACWEAFQKWADVSAFTFEEASPGQTPDIDIGFYSRDHGDMHPFDGPGNTVAHSFYPTDGRFHYDADEQWSVEPGSTETDLETVALHEMGHLLGLGHSSDPDAIMFPTIPMGDTKRRLHQDDIDGIHALYPEQRKGPGVPFHDHISNVSTFSLGNK